MSRVIVVGGGIAGLATAALVAHDGHDVTLLERRTALGGRAGEVAEDGFRFETGPSWYLMPEVYEHFFRSLGSSRRRHYRLRTLDPGFRVYNEGYDEPIDMPRGVAGAAAVFEGIEAGAGAALRRYLASASDAYELALERFLYSPSPSVRDLFTPELVRRSPTLVGLLSRSLESFIASRFHDPRLQKILGYPAVFLGSSPDRTPALYHLMSHLDLARGVQYPEGGFAAVVRALESEARRAGAAIVTNAPVSEIITEGGMVRGVRSADGDALPADVVVSTADVHHTETGLLSRDARRYRSRHWRRQTVGPSAVLVMAGVRGGLPGLDHHTLFFAGDWRANFDAIFGRPARIPPEASLYACKPSASDRVAPGGHENLFLLVPLPPDPSIGHGNLRAVESDTVRRISDDAVARVASWSGEVDLPARIVVRRTVGPADFEDDFRSLGGSALGPAHTLRQSAFLRGRIASRTVRGLYYAGATSVPGIGVPMCLISAELVLKHLRRDRTPGPIRES